MPLHPTQALFESNLFNIYKGSDRYAIVGRNLTFKFPVVNPTKFISNAIKIKREYGFSTVYKNLKSYKPHQGGLSYWILRGVQENRRERRLASQYPDIVAPTRTVLGLCNVQPTLDPLQSSEREVWLSFVDQLNGRAPVLGHMMEDTSNLGLDNEGSVLFVDGGSRGLERLLPEKKGEIAAALGTIAVHERELAH